MIKKIVGIFICMFLISSTTTLALTSFNIDVQQKKLSSFDTKPVSLPANKGWMKTYGGGRDDYGYSVQQTTDDGYIITGYTESFGAGNNDAWLIKTTANGIKIWDKTFGGISNDRGFSVQQTNDGGYIITGFTESFGAGNNDVWLIKTKANGDKIWDKTFGGTGYDQGYSVQQTSDERYIIIGCTSSFGAGNNDVWLIKTTANGNKIWDKTFGGTENDQANSVQQTTDGGYIITGYTSSFGAGHEDVWLIKTDANGEIIWDKTFGGTENDQANSVQQTTDGGYIITGYTSSFGAGGKDVWLIKTDANGEIIWDKTFGGASWEEGNSVQQTTDDGYIITGYITTSAGYAGWLIKTDSDGNVIWNRKFGETVDYAVGYSVQQISDSGYIITGIIINWYHIIPDDPAHWDVLLIKTDNSGRPRNKTISNPFINYLQKYFNQFSFLQKLLLRLVNNI